MPNIVFVSPDGTRKSVFAEPGTSVMRAAVANGVDGIIGECGGALLCATCHVFIEKNQMDLLQPPEGSENDMLEFTATEPTSESRLGCQITLTEEMEGLTLHLPETQK